MAETSEARKRREAALFSEPQWQSDPACCDLHGRVLTALRRVYGSSDLGEAVALADALEDAGIRKRITPHSFRHTFVTMALDSGQKERDIAASTGHADSRMVAYYDRGRDSIARNATHAVAAWVEGAS